MQAAPVGVLLRERGRPLGGRGRGEGAVDEFLLRRLWLAALLGDPQGRRQSDRRRASLSIVLLAARWSRSGCSLG